MMPCVISSTDARQVLGAGLTPRQSDMICPFLYALFAMTTARAESSARRVMRDAAGADMPN